MPRDSFLQFSCRSPHPVRLTVFAACLLAATASVSIAEQTEEDASHSTQLTAQAIAFVEEAEAELALLSRVTERAQFGARTNETLDHVRLQADISQIVSKAQTHYATEAARFDGVPVPESVARKLRLLKLGATLPAPSVPELQGKLSDILSEMETTYTTAADCTNLPNCRKKSELYEILRSSRDPAELLSAWEEWRQPASEFRGEYQRMVEIANAGAKELGYSDVGALWRSHYDLPPGEFQAEYDRLWGQVRPLYDALHCHVRAKLRDAYGDLVPAEGPIPSHLLGNMWAQDWTGIDDLVGIESTAPKIDLTSRLELKRLTPLDLVEIGEGFFVSLGFPELPESFWERSMLTEPERRKVNCHPSAWPVDPPNDDVRLAMCVEVNEDDFKVVHHELGHIYYYLSYADLPFLFQEGANPGFHEAVGDALALSMTPAYLKHIGLLDETPSDDAELPYLFRTALEKIPALALGYIIDLWRWKVFSGEIAPEQYNEAWWELRNSLQGVAPATARSEEEFDAGMLYHITFSVPYDRYFMASILQFDFHRAMCEASGHQGPLHTCSIFGSQEAGRRLERTLDLGRSKPWPDALEELTGSRVVDASSILRYFEPVMDWLERENQGRDCGW